MRRGADRNACGSHLVILEDTKMKFITKSIVAGCAATLLAPLVGIAEDAKNQGYLVDTWNNNIVRAPVAGVCVRTSDWTPARAVAECDPDLVKKPAPPAPPPAKPAPPPPPPPPSPPPKPAPPPPPPEKPLPQKISLSADALFDFDKAVLKTEGKGRLDDLVRTLQGATYDVILVIGHTDRIGSVEYNQKLSLRRANAVKDYLVGHGIEQSRISAEGRGKSQPVTKPGECTGPRSKKLIACLQPDRRVEVQVSASKTPGPGVR
jgi:OmpA-OmpF porin, OOP family